MALSWTWLSMRNNGFSIRFLAIGSVLTVSTYQGIMVWTEACSKTTLSITTEHWPYGKQATVVDLVDTPLSCYNTGGILPTSTIMKPSFSPSITDRSTERTLISMLCVCHPTIQVSPMDRMGTLIGSVVTTTPMVISPLGLTHSVAAIMFLMTGMETTCWLDTHLVSTSELIISKRGKSTTMDSDYLYLN